MLWTARSGYSRTCALASCSLGLSFQFVTCSLCTVCIPTDKKMCTISHLSSGNIIYSVICSSSQYQEWCLPESVFLRSKSHQPCLLRNPLPYTPRLALCIYYLVTSCHICPAFHSASNILSHAGSHFPAPPVCSYFLILFFTRNTVGLLARPKTANGPETGQLRHIRPPFYRNTFPRPGTLGVSPC